MAPRTCPRCGFEGESDVECPRCGVVFAKLKPESTASPEPAARSGEPPAGGQAAAWPGAVAAVAPGHRFPVHRRASLALRQLGRLFEAGVPLREGLRAVAAGCGDRRLAEGLDRVAADIDQGQGLAQACAASGLFATHQVALLAAGEASGQIGDKLVLIAAEGELKLRIRRRVMAALAYPTALVVLASFILPASLVLTAGVGAYLEAALTPILIVGGLGAGLFLGLPALLRRLDGGRSLARLARVVPLVSPAYSLSRLATFCTCAADGLAAGLALEPSLETAAAAADDPLLADAVRAALTEIRGGSGLAQALGRQGVLPPDLRLALEAGERSGTLPAVLRELAAAYEEDHDHALRRLVGVLALGAALLVIFLVVYMIVSQYAQTMGDLERQLQELMPANAPTMDEAMQKLQDGFKLLDEEMRR